MILSLSLSLYMYPSLYLSLALSQNYLLQIEFKKAELVTVVIEIGVLLTAFYIYIEVLSWIKAYIQTEHASQELHVHIYSILSHKSLPSLIISLFSLNSVARLCC